MMMNNELSSQLLGMKSAHLRAMSSVNSDPGVSGFKRKLPNSGPGSMEHLAKQKRLKAKREDIIRQMSGSVAHSGISSSRSRLLGINSVRIGVYFTTY